MNKKKLIFHCGYPKAASTYIIQNITNIVGKDLNCININYNNELLRCFNFIKNSDTHQFNKKKRHVKITLKKYLTDEINFFTYEKVFHISEKINTKIIFFKRLKKMSNILKINLKILICLRDEIEFIKSSYIEEYFKLILINIKFCNFKNFIDSLIIKRSAFILLNLKYKKIIYTMYKIFNKKNILICKLDELKKNKKKFFKSIMKFSSINNYNLKLLSPEIINKSSDKKLFFLIKLRIIEYLTLKKRFKFSTIINFAQILIRLLFLQKYLLKNTIINKEKRKKLLSAINN
jgi:hypothetical protein